MKGSLKGRNPWSNILGQSTTTKSASYVCSVRQRSCQDILRTCTKDPTTGREVLFVTSAARVLQRCRALDTTEISTQMTTSSGVGPVTKASTTTNWSRSTRTSIRERSPITVVYWRGVYLKQPLEEAHEDSRRPAALILPSSSIIYYSTILPFYQSPIKYHQPLTATCRNMSGIRIFP